MHEAANTIVAYTDAHGVCPLKGWMARLRDKTALAKIDRQIARMRLGLRGDIRPVGEGISELRIHYGPGYRVYYGKRGERICILLCGGDKSTQPQDIKKAKAYWKDYKRRNLI